MLGQPNPEPGAERPRMTEPPADIQQRLQALRADYLRQLPRRRAAITGAWRALRQAPADPARLHRFHRLVHGLAGSGTSFGLPELSAAARTLEQACRALESKTPEPGDLDALEDLLAELERMLEQVARDK